MGKKSNSGPGSNFVCADKELFSGSQWSYVDKKVKWGKDHIHLMHMWLDQSIILTAKLHKQTKYA